MTIERCWAASSIHYFHLIKRCSLRAHYVTPGVAAAILFLPPKLETWEVINSAVLKRILSKYYNVVYNKWVMWSATLSLAHECFYWCGTNNEKFLRVSVATRYDDFLWKNHFNSGFTANIQFISAIMVDFWKTAKTSQDMIVAHNIDICSKSFVFKFVVAAA